MAELEIKMGDIQVSANRDDIFVAAGVGSCLIIALYDRRRRIGALAHAVLPQASGPRRPGKRSLNGPRACYVDAAIDEMLKRMTELGASPNDLEAKLIGGANMFPDLREDLGQDNVRCAERALQDRGVAIVGQAVGGSQGRSIRFFVGSGDVQVISRF